MERDKGGRPPKTKIKHVLPYIVKDLSKEFGKCSPAMIQRKYNEDNNDKVDLHTIHKYIRECVDEGSIQKHPVSDNTQKVKQGTKKRKRVLAYYTA